MALEPLFRCIARSDAREEEAVYATENACSAIAKIIHFNASNIPNIESVIGSWLDTLPIIHDEEEGPHAYNILMDLVARYVISKSFLIEVVHTLLQVKFQKYLTLLLRLSSTVQSKARLSTEWWKSPRNCWPLCRQVKRKDYSLPCLLNDKLL
jgi:hypothetical protein